MSCEHSGFHTERENNEKIAPMPSRLLDEKVSDESGTESSADKALAPVGLDNPFWN
jgi:hypothetical protein